MIGRKGEIAVIFGEDKDPAILGVTTLEALGLEVDPIKKYIKRSYFINDLNEIIQIFATTPLCFIETCKILMLNN